VCHTLMTIIACCWLQIEVTEEGMRVGASVPLSTLLEVLRAEIKSQPAHKTSTFRAVVEQLRWFAGVQV
jgi:xanthine dehydrogenase/oxidase